MSSGSGIFSTISCRTSIWAKANYGVVKDNPGKLDVNFGRRQDREIGFHINSLDYNETLGQMVVNNSTDSEFYVIDHQGTFVPGDAAASIALAAGRKGDFLFRWWDLACVCDSGVPA